MYLVSRFPKITETFVLDEVLELRRTGVDVRVLSLLRTDEQVVHPGAAEVVADARFGSRSVAVLLRAQAHWLRRRPVRLVQLWLRVLVLNRTSLGEWAKSVATAAAACAWAVELDGQPVHRLHAHWATHPALAAHAIAALTDLPYGFTAHAHDLYGENGMLGEKLRAADLVVTISQYNQQLLADRYGDVGRKARLLHCGVDRSVFPVAPLPADDGPLRLLTVASLSDYKGHRHLLDAVASVRARGVRLELTLVGDGPLREELEAQTARLGLTGAVAFLGRQPAPEVRRLLRECDVFVLPSVVTADGMMEGIPVALMEAMATGRPVLATRLSGIPELVEDGVTGLLVHPGDAAALAQALGRLADDDALRRRLAEAAPERVADGFDQQENVARLRGWFGLPPVGTSG